MNSRSQRDPWQDFSLSHSGVLARKSPQESPAKKSEIPFYVSQSKTSAEIIEEAKATMSRPGSFPAIASDSRSGFRTVDTKRPFTPRQTDRRLYSGSTNHVARPPSSFRLLPLPEEDFSRPATGTRLSPLSSQSSIDGGVELENGKLPKIVQQQQLSAPARPSTREGKRSQFRACTSLSDVLEVCEFDKIENISELRKTHSSPKERLPGEIDSEQSEKQEPGLLIEKVAHGGTKPKRKSSRPESEDPVLIAEKPAKSSEEIRLEELLEELRDSQFSDSATVGQKLDNLYRFIGGCSNKKFLNKKRGEIVRIIGLYVDTDSPEVLILLVQILLSVQVRRQNLATAYKLVFKIAREAENDACFMSSDALDLIINSIGLACPVNDSEALVYGYGALKFLTMNSSTREKLRTMGILDLVLLHLKLICEAKSERRVTDETSHVLFQLTGVIRNLVNDVAAQRSLVDLGGVAQISKCLKLFMTDLDVVSNIARTLSVMSSDDDVCSAIAEDPLFTSTAVAVLKKYPGRQDIVVRLTYCLGNLMAKCDEARSFAKNDAEKAMTNMDTILELLQSYRARDARPNTSKQSMVMKMESEDDHGSSGNSEDVVIKIIRVIANMSINGDVGQQVAGMSEVYDNLTDILATRSISENEELILSTLATLNNLTYYPADTENKDQQDVAVFKRIQTFIDCSNVEAQIESSRVLGNLTRSRVIRDQLAGDTTWRAVVELLTSEQRDLVYTNVGVIVNMMSDSDKRRSLKSLGGVSRLISVLKDCGGQTEASDWLLASLTCQAIWNYSIDTNNLFDCMDKEEISELEAVLVEFLDEETIFGSQDELSSEQIPRYHEWEEFAKVGVNLLERLESFLEPLNMGIDNQEEEEEEEEDEDDENDGVDGDDDDDNDEEEIIYERNGKNNTMQ